VTRYGCRPLRRELDSGVSFDKRERSDIVKIPSLVCPNGGFVACVLTVVAVSACNDTSTTSASGVLAQVQIAVSPTTVSAKPSPDPDYQYEADFTLNLSETAGTGATVDAINATVAEMAGGIAVNTGTVVDQVHVNSTSNRLNALGTLAIPLQVLYTLPGGGTQAQVAITLTIVDDNGVSVGGNLTVDVE
jgi:hypothetical protein